MSYILPSTMDNIDQIMEDPKGRAKAHKEINWALDLLDETKEYKDLLNLKNVEI